MAAGILLGAALATYQVTGYGIVSIAGYSITLADVCVLLGIAYFAVEFFMGRQKYRLPLSLPYLLLLLIPVPLALSAIAPLLYGGDIVQVVKSNVHFWYLWLFAVFAAVRSWQAKEVELAMRLFLVMCVLVAAFGIYQLFARAFGLPLAWFELTNTSILARTEFIAEDDFRQLSLRFKNFYRATSIFSEPSYLAAYCTLGLTALLLPTIQGTKKWFSPFFSSVSIGILSLALFATFSLTSLVGLGLFFALTSLWEGAAQRKRIVKGAAVFLLVAAVGDILLYSVFNISVAEMSFHRVEAILNLDANPYKENMSGESFQYRASLIAVSIQVWLEAPFTGVGLGLFYASAAARLNEMLFSISSYFTLLSETGIQGLLPFAAFLGLLQYSALVSLKSRRAMFSLHTTGASGIAPYWCVLLIFYGFTMNIIVQPMTWVLAGAIFACMIPQHNGRIIELKAELLRRRSEISPS